MTAAGEMLERSREDHAEALAAAAAAGGTPKASGQMRSARAALADAEDEAQAARAALEHHEAEGAELEAEDPRLANEVLVRVSQTVAPVCEKLLEGIRRRQIELAALQSAFLALTDEETIGVPVFNSDVQRLNAKDARRAPVGALRDEVYGSSRSGAALERAERDRKAAQDRAQETAAAFRHWRTALRTNPDLPMPELP